MPKKIPFFRDIVFIGSILTTCLLCTQCVKCQDEHSALNSNKKIFSVSKPKRQGNAPYYLEISVRPLQAGADLVRYTLQALNTVGKGELKASTGKEGVKHKYDKTFTSLTSLDAFYFIEGNVSDFQSGTKAVKIKCMYCPEGTPKAEEHRLKIKACAYDSDQQLVQEQEEEVVFTYTADNSPQKTKGGNKKRENG